MITDKFIREMEEIVGKAHVSVSRANAELYSYDASLARGKPGVVVFPADSQETARIARAAHRAGIKTIILPDWNRKDLEDIPPKVKKEIQFHFVDKMMDVIQIALNSQKPRVRVRTKKRKTK